MDAVKFIEERKRMCEAHAGCPGCPAFRGVDSCIFSVNTSASSSEQVELVEDWSIAHPRKTRQSVFLEQWTQARLDDNGCLYICPADVSANYRDESGGCAVVDVLCPDCRREFWTQEIE